MSLKFITLTLEYIPFVLGRAESSKDTQRNSRQNTYKPQSLQY